MIKVLALGGCKGITIGVHGTALGTGAQNTIAIEAGCTTVGTAADICTKLTLNGYTDWFLPSLNELEKLMLNKDSIGGFTDGYVEYYWASSEVVGENTPYLMKTNTEIISGPTKDIQHRVRAVRSF